jgi:hypothetical protein
MSRVRIPLDEFLSILRDTIQGAGYTHSRNHRSTMILMDTREIAIQFVRLIALIGRYSRVSGCDDVYD